MKRKDEISPPVSKAKLLAAVENTYNDSRFLIGQRVDEKGDFFKGLCLNRSTFWQKEELLEFIRTSPPEEFPAIPDHPDLLVLSSTVNIWRDSIDDNQVYQTDPPPGYHHVAEQGNPHYEMYFQVDHEKKTISFCLGDLKRTLLLKEHTDYCWKPTKTHIYCATSEWLERSLLDPFWSRTVVHLARHVLRIKSAI